MTAKRRPDRKKPRPKRDLDRPARGSSGLRVRQAAGEEAWELVHPRSAHDRNEDLQEVRKMIDAGEVEVARDELRWLLGGCSDFVDAHRLLGELALLQGDLPLARGHFGYAFQIGAQAMRGAPPKAVFPYRLPSNEQFFEAGKGLAWCLMQLDKADMAREVVEQLLKFDPTDPLGVQGLLDAKAPCAGLSGNDAEHVDGGQSEGAPAAEERSARPRREHL